MNRKNIITKKHKQACSATLDDDHHAIMNGPRIAQSLPEEYLEALLRAAVSQNTELSHIEDVGSNNSVQK